MRSVVGLDERISRYLRHIRRGRQLVPQAWGRTETRSLLLVAFLIIAVAIAWSVFKILEVRAVDTGFLSPSAQAADTGGEGDGFEQSPANAFADGGGFATDSEGDGDNHRYFNYNIPVPTGATVDGID